jgi:hypothetical protein
MNTAQRFEQLKDLEVGPERREAVRVYLLAHKGIVDRVAARVPVHRSVVSKVLHGRAVSAPVVQALMEEEQVVAA